MKNPSDLLLINDGLAPKDALARYAKRRQDLVQATGIPCLIFSVDAGPGEPNPWVHLSAPMYQDPYFLYLTGLTQFPAAVLILPSGDEVLFLPPRDPKREFWEGVEFGAGDPEACIHTGFSRIEDLDNLPDIVSSLLSPTETLGLIWHRDAKGELLEDSHDAQNDDFLSSFQTPPQHRSITPEFWPLRLKMDETDITNLRRAIAITHQALLTCQSKLSECHYEYQAAGHLEGAMLSQTPFGLSFPTIMAAGPQAGVLHYTRNDQPLASGQMLLIDFGARWQSMMADISRTIPLSGVRNPMQDLLYHIVLDAQALVESLVKPGVTIQTLNTACWDFINTQLQDRFVALGGKFTLPYPVQPHNIGHLLGRQVHDGDPFREYRTMPLQAGWVITNEPGLYGHFELTLDGVSYVEDLGIRIEDNLLVTTDGCENLSCGIEK